MKVVTITPLPPNNIKFEWAVVSGVVEYQFEASNTSDNMLTAPTSTSGTVVSMPLPKKSDVPDGKILVTVEYKKKPNEPWEILVEDEVHDVSQYMPNIFGRLWARIKQFKLSQVEISPKLVYWIFSIILLTSLTLFFWNPAMNLFQSWQSDKRYIQTTTSPTATPAGVVIRRERAKGSAPSIDISNSTNVNVVVSFGDAPIIVGAYPAGSLPNAGEWGQTFPSVGEKIRPRPEIINSGLQTPDKFKYVMAGDRQVTLEPGESAMLYLNGNKIEEIEPEGSTVTPSTIRGISEMKNTLPQRTEFQLKWQIK